MSEKLRKPFDFHNLANSVELKYENFDEVSSTSTLSPVDIEKSENVAVDSPKVTLLRSDKELFHSSCKIYIHFVIQDERPFICGLCMVAFDTQKELIDHQRLGLYLNRLKPKTF